MSINARVSRTCDTHVHVFDPKRYPYSADRTYTSGSAAIEHLRAFLDAWMRLMPFAQRATRIGGGIAVSVVSALAALWGL